VPPRGSPRGGVVRTRTERGEKLNTTKGKTMASAIPKDFRRVVVAAAAGNVIEWYDFYIFGSLAAILSVKFFDKTHRWRPC